MASPGPNSPLRLSRPLWARRITVLAALLLLGAGVSSHHDSQRHGGLDPLGSAWQSLDVYPGASHPYEAEHLEPSDRAVEPGCGACLLSLQTVAIGILPSPGEVVLALRGESRPSSTRPAARSAVSLAPSRAPPASLPT
jgi:hypothetical protein